MNIEKAVKEFINYTENYDLENERIKNKQEHSIRVMKVAKQIAEKLNLGVEQVEIATLIGLLHDIARFEQYTKYKTFHDLESIDHGDYAVKILDKDLRKYIETDKYDEIIKKAIKNHNKYKIEDGLTDEEMLYAKLIRDADKIDILYESVEIFWKGRENEVEESVLSEKILEQIKSNSQVKREKGRHLKGIDEIMSVISLIYDINFKQSLEIIKENDYINKILNRYHMKDENTKNVVEEIRKNVNRYIEQKVQM